MKGQLTSLIARSNYVCTFTHSKYNIIVSHVARPPTFLLFGLGSLSYMEAEDWQKWGRPGGMSGGYKVDIGEAVPNYKCMGTGCESSVPFKWSTLHFMSV